MIGGTLMKHIIIGDVHGCLSELKALLNKICLQPDDVIVFVGDLVMKGPSQVGAVQFARELSYFNETILVRGNHEERLLRYLTATVEDPEKAAAMKKAAVLSTIARELHPEDVVFLSESSYFYMFISGEREFVVIHAGITPKMAHSQFFKRPLSGKGRRRLKQLCHVRYISEDGSMNAFCEKEDSKNFWAEAYDGRFGYAVYGHQVYKNVTEHKHAVGIDLGCVYGNKLAALVIENGQQHVVTVDAERTYYSESPGLI
jgi:predicted phosphodiesterase